MLPVPVVSSKAAVIAFTRAGKQLERHRGSHVILIKDGSIHTCQFLYPIHWVQVSSMI